MVFRKRQIGSFLRSNAAAFALGIRILGIACLPLPAHASNLQEELIVKKLSPFLPRNALWSLVVVDMATGKEMIGVGNATGQALAPGSLVKLFISGATLDVAGSYGKPDMRTTLSSDGIIQAHEITGNIYLVGGGDSLLSSVSLQKMVRELSHRGITQIQGDLIVDASLLDVQGLERNWSSGAGQATPGALGLDLHTVSISVAPTRAGTPPAVTVDPVNSAVRVAMEARTLDSSANTLKIAQLDDTSYRITGNIPTGAAPVRKRFPLHDPAMYAGGTLRTILRENKIVLKGDVKNGQKPAGAMPLAEVYPSELGELLRDMNMNSLNVVADNLLLLIGSKRFSSPGTRDKGLRAVREFMARLDLETADSKIADGSGIHKENRVTTGVVAHYLQKASQQPWFETLFATLPRAGMDGTLRGMGFVDERFRAKTGNLKDAYGLAGYGSDRNGRRLAFAFIVNHPGSGVINMEQVGAEVMKSLSTEVFS